MKWLICVFLISGLAWSRTLQPPQLLPSLEWQKVVLKQDLETKTKEVLSKVLKAEEFLVTAKIDLTTPQMPDFKKQHAPIAATSETTRLHKVKASNAAPTNDPYGYIVFHKMGLEVPLVEEFKDDEVKTQNKNQKADDGNDFENIWKYNKALDIYNNIDHVAISVKITDKVTINARSKLESLVKGIGYDIPSVQPDVKFEYVDFHLEKSFKAETVAGPKKVEPTWFEKVIAFAEKFQLPITLFVSVFMLGMFGLMLMKKYKQILEENAAGSQTLTMEGGGDQDNKTGSAPAENTPSLVAQSVMERFIAYLDQAPRECTAMVKSWLREPDANQILGLNVIIEELPNDKLTHLVSMLSEEDKGKLRATVQVALKPAEMTKAKEFISAQVRDEILKGEKIDDPELQEMLLAISPKKAAQMVMDQPEFVSMLFSKLSPRFLGLILEQLNDENKSAVLNQALGQKTLSDVKVFKSVLYKYADIEIFSPALEKIKLILPDSSKSTEETLYQAIAKHGNAQSVKACALRNFPYQLITSLPEDMLKEALLQFDSIKRIEYLETLANDDKEYLINAFAPPGSKARDIYELDYERVFSNEEANARIKADADTIAKNFVIHLRDFMRKNPQFKGKVATIVGQWADNMAAEFNSIPKLKIVA
jgi:hypothetical protein